MKSNFRNDARILRYMEITIIGVSEAHFRAFLGSFHIVKKDLKAYLKEGKKPRKKIIAECFLGGVGIDPGFEDIDKSNKNLTGKLVGDEPFYDSSDADSFESESEGEIDIERSDNLRARKKNKRVSYDPTWKKVVWQLNMVFENVKKFREALSKYAIERGCQLDKIHNDQRRVRVKCKANGCPWILYASKDFKSSDFIIKTYNPRHRCYRTNTNTMCNSKFLAKYYKSRIVSQPCIKGWEIQDLVRTDIGLYVGKFVCLKARKMVLKKIMGDHVAEFSRIYDYRDGKKLFHSFYICFSALKKGFIEGCRKCIGLDGCFLKGISKGQLLVAIAKDENNQMFPIAWAVVGTESRETWTWFLRILKSDLDINDEGEGLTIISDMQKVRLLSSGFSFFSQY
ncbi:hypothetical protein KY285_005919 [Solanum tuberosum]|nr:hypothetical protein KY284_006080 [Solanum tuberosum]KAH0752771.1 hypothetical protein KY285_005919 [Solanum tuberosum]